MRNQGKRALLVLAAVLAMIGVNCAQEVLPRPEPPFKGHICLTPKDSTLDFLPETKAPKGAPNILLILTDDVGFGAISTFGGPVPTSTLIAWRPPVSATHNSIPRHSARPRGRLCCPVGTTIPMPRA